MMNLYFTKKDTYGMPAGVVERFHVSKAGALLADGTLEPYDAENGKHRAAAEQAGYAPKPKDRTPPSSSSARK
jgi:hypothetical protein